MSVLVRTITVCHLRMKSEFGGDVEEDAQTRNTYGVSTIGENKSFHRRMKK